MTPPTGIAGRAPDGRHHSPLPPGKKAVRVSRDENPVTLGIGFDFRHSGKQRLDRMHRCIMEQALVAQWLG
jgi:hypothetical protein